MQPSKHMFFLAASAMLVACGANEECPDGFLADNDGNCLQFDAGTHSNPTTSSNTNPTGSTTTNGSTTTTTTTTTSNPLDEDFVNNGPGNGYFWETTDRNFVVDDCDVEIGHSMIMRYLGEGFTISESSVRDQTFLISPTDLALGGAGDFADSPVYAHSLSPSICSYELEGDFSCTSILRDYDFVGFHDEINRFLPPYLPPLPDPDLVLSYSVTASGMFGERNAVAGPAVAWDFGMPWAADLSLQMTIDCAGTECDFVLLNTNITSFPCTTVLEFDTANLDDPNIPS